MTASADSADTAEAMIDEVEQEIRQRIGDYIFSNVAGETIQRGQARTEDPFRSDQNRRNQLSNKRNTSSVNPIGLPNGASSGSNKRTLTDVQLPDPPFLSNPIPQQTDPTLFDTLSG